MKAFIFLLALCVGGSGFAHSLDIRETQNRGMKVWTFSHDQNPLIGLCLIFPRGAALESESIDGACGLMENLLFEGTPHYTQEQFRDFLDNHGLQISVACQLDHTKVIIMCPTQSLPSLFEALEEVFAAPRFATDRLEHVRRLTLASLKKYEESQEYHGQKVFKKIACAGHACERTHVGSEKTIASLTQDDLKALYRRLFNREGLKVLMGGDLNGERQEEILVHLEKIFPADQSDPVETFPLAPSPLTGKMHFISFDSPQAQVTYYKKGVRQEDPHFFPLKIASYIIAGHPMSSRLGEVLRVKKSLVYGNSEGVDSTAYQPLIRGWTTTRTETVDAVYNTIKEVFGHVRESGVTEEEVRQAKIILEATFSRYFRTLQGTLFVLSNFMECDLPVTYCGQRNQFVEAVTLDQVNEAIRAFYDPAQMTTIVVGNKAPDGAIIETVTFP